VNEYPGFGRVQFNGISVFGSPFDKTKTVKTPLMMAVAFGPTCCFSGLVPESKLSHSPEVQYGFVPKLSPHGGKNTALRAKKQSPHRAA
jgi:hypothetical protein